MTCAPEIASDFSAKSLVHIFWTQKSIFFSVPRNGTRSHPPSYEINGGRESAAPAGGCVPGNARSRTNGEPLSVSQEEDTGSGGGALSNKCKFHVYDSVTRAELKYEVLYDIHPGSQSVSEDAALSF